MYVTSCFCSKVSATFWSLTWEEEPLMSQFWPLRMESLRWNPHLETLTWVVKTLTIEWWTTLFRNSSANTRRTFLKTSELSDVWGQPVKGQRGPCPQALRPALRLTLCSRVSISTQVSPGLGLRSWMLIYSEAPWSPWRRLWEMPSWTRPRSTTSSWSEDPHVSQRFRNYFRTSSTARNWTNPSTLTRLLLMEQVRHANEMSYVCHLMKNDFEK